MNHETLPVQGPVDGTVSRRRKAEDFHVGQDVVVEDAEAFISSVANYLKGRTGVVVEIWPSDTPRDSPMRKNQLRVKWGKRNGRGVEKEMVMHPRNLLPANAELRGASRLHGEASLSNDVLGADAPERNERGTDDNE